MHAVPTEDQIALLTERYPLIRHVFALAQKRGDSIYLVGGTVRDLMLGRDIHDLDFATPGDGLTLARHIADHMGGAFVPIDRDRKTGRVILSVDGTGFAPGKPESNGSYAMHLDIASLRGNSLAADLRGRDFTINAMAIELSANGQWRLHDIVGGRQDLADRVLRMASSSSLIQDPVRMLRAVRLQMQFRCTIDPATRKSIYCTAPLLSRVSAERVRDEWFKILQQQDAPDAVLELDQLRLLQTIAPPIAHLDPGPTDASAAPAARRTERLSEGLASLRAIERLWAVLSGTALDSRLHLPQALVALAPQIRSRYEATICDERTFLGLLKCAALLQNAGSAPESLAVGSPKDHASSEADVLVTDADTAAAETAAALGRQWHCSNREVDLLYTVVLHYHYAGRLLTDTDEPTLNRRTIYRYYKATGKYGVDAALVALANALAQESDSPGPGWIHQAENAARLLAPYLMRRTEQLVPSSLLSGHDLIQTLHLTPGPQIGSLLARLCEEQAAGEIHTREQAIDWLRGLLEQTRRLDQE